MDKKPIVLLQQRDFGQKMNASFQFVTQNFVPLLKSILLIAGPAALVAGIASGLFLSRTGSPRAGLSTQFEKYWSIEYLLVIIFSSVTYFLAYATVSAFITLYEEYESSELLTPSVVWGRVTENMASLIGVVLLVLLVTILGTLLLIIPGIYLSIALQFSLIIAIRERLPAMEALRKSQKLIKDKWWSTFGLLFIMSMVAGVISIVFQLPVFITTILATLGLGGDPSNMKVWTIVASAISVVGSTVVQGLIWVALAFQYYNLTERNTGASLIAEIDELGR
jgi:hypothetical protein